MKDMNDEVEMIRELSNEELDAVAGGTLPPVQVIAGLPPIPIFNPQQPHDATIPPPDSTRDSTRRRPDGSYY